MQNKIDLLNAAINAGLIADSDIGHHIFIERDSQLALLCDDNIFRNMSDIETLIGFSALTLESCF